MSDPLRRGIRTLVQLLVAASVGLGGLVAGHVLSVEDATRVAAVLAFLTPLVTIIQNALEDAGKVPTLLGKPLPRRKKV